MRIGIIPELYLREVRIPTLPANSGILPDNYRIVQGVFIDLCAGAGFTQSWNGLDKVGMSSV